MKKELRPFHDHVTCAVCGRTMLKGERAEAYMTDAGERHLVCDLCFTRADRAGWVRESDHGRIPTRGPRQPERRGLLRRKRRSEEPVSSNEQAPPEYLQPPDAGDDAYEPPVEHAPPPPPPKRRREPPQDPRHVRAVPTTVEGRVERALELFNSSEHQRTVAGLARSLGSPWVAAQPEKDAASTVTVLVGWELSWYRYRVDLGDAVQPVELFDKGDELEDVDEDLREWNAELDERGRLVIGVTQP